MAGMARVGKVARMGRAANTEVVTVVRVVNMEGDRVQGLTRVV